MIMHEYVYKLNLPPVADILLDPKILFTNDQSEHPTIYPDIENHVRPEWINFNNETFKYLLLFYKPDLVGRLHIDEFEKLRRPEEPCLWGINWVHNGSRLVEFWNVDELVPNEDNYNCSIRDFAKKLNTVELSTVQPCRSYTTESGSAYLINASVPHRATGSGLGYVVSLRADYRTVNKTWPLVVDQFKQYIIQ